MLSVDLSTCQKSNRFDEGTYAKDVSGWVRTRRSDSSDRSSFSYRFIGSLPSVTMVLHVYEDGGGSGVFESVMLLAVASELTIGSDGKQRTQLVLRVLRTVSIGDRANAEVSIDGKTVRVDRSKAHDDKQRTPLVIDDSPPLH